jgi:hypothetical protein
MKRELNRRLTRECRCDERLKVTIRDRHVSDTLGCPGTGTPKDSDEVNTREVCECDASVNVMCQFLYLEVVDRPRRVHVPVSHHDLTCRAPE